jgi:putative spermidine/putrescine transport system ATP-binding protein
VIYLGDHLRLRCVVANQVNATVKIALSSQAMPQPGDAIWLQLPPEHLRIYL